MVEVDDVVELVVDDVVVYLLVLYALVGLWVGRYVVVLYGYFLVVVFFL